MTTRLLPPDAQNGRDISVAVNAVIQGRINSVGTVTLAASAASTVVKDPRVGPTSVILLFPQTLHASAEIAAGGIYVAPANYVQRASFTITHANNGQADRTFGYAILGG